MTNDSQRRAAPGQLKWVVSDVDGTIVNRDKEVTEASRDAARRLRAAGIGLTIASSRPPWGMRHVAEALQIDGPIAGFNGAVVVDRAGKALRETRIPAEAARAALELLEAEKISAWLFTDSQWLVLDPDGPHVAHEQRTIRSDPAVVADFAPWAAQGCKIVGASDDYDHLADVARRMGALLGTSANSGLSQKYYLDVTPPGVDKGSAVAFVSEAFAIPAAAIAVIGDMDNDVAMFRKAGFAIAMGNGSPAALAAADMVTRSNNEDGFAAAIEALLDGRTSV
ncbi:HAD family hydrolase [Camelimonas sp. ID_303_24]